MGTCHQYPCGPTCIYEGKTIPCMVAFNPGEGITATILTDIFWTLDNLNIFSCKNGIKLFAPLDGHSTRFDLKFLEYINDEKHKWSVCIGIPYGTSLWQVGDSAYQNSQFKVRVRVKKEKILEARSVKQMAMEITPTDIIPIVNYAWHGSFDNVVTNKKAILDRGWFPLNRMLLLHPDIRKTMTEQDKTQEQESGLCPKKTQTKSKIDLPTMDPMIYNRSNTTDKTKNSLNVIVQQLLTA
jgi:hypothetical protein